MSSLKILINALQFLEICIVSHTRLWKTHVASPRKGNIQWIPVKKLIKQNFWLGMLQNRKFHAVLHTLGLEKKIIFVFLAFCDLLCSWSSHPTYAVNFSTTALPRHLFVPCSSFPLRHFTNSSADTSEFCPVLPLIGSLLSSAKMFQSLPTNSYSFPVFSQEVEEKKEKKMSLPFLLICSGWLHKLTRTETKGKKINVFSMSMLLEPFFLRKRKNV